MTETLPRPPYDPELVALQEAQIAAVAETDPALADQMRRPWTIKLDYLAQIRQSTAARDAAAREQLERSLPGLGIEHTDFTVPGLDDGPDVTIAVFRSREARTGAPAVFWIHGGGMLLGDRFGLEVGLLDWVVRYGLVIASVEYRLAPENPDPAPLHDAYAGFIGFVDAADRFGVNPERIVVAGGSAGGGLAAGVALLARDRQGPRAAGQLLICPMLDDRNDTISSRQFSGTGLWDRESNEAGWTALLGDRRGTDSVTGYAAPARATDLSDLPPAFIDVGSAEVFRDEDVAYASRIWEAGGQAELHVWPGGYHGFHAAAPDSSIGRGANRVREEWVARILAL